MPKLQCIQCGGSFYNLYEDKRVPPLDVGDCLCGECSESSVDEIVEELEEEINNLNSYKEKITNYK